MSGTTGRPEHDPGIRKALLDFALANVAKVSLVEVTANLYAAIADWHRREMERVQRQRDTLLTRLEGYEDPQTAREGIDV